VPTPRIKQLTLTQFRSCAQTSVDFGDVTFAVGRNAAGKSNLLDALAFISEVSSEPLIAVLDRRGGIEAVRRRVGGRGAPHQVRLQVDLGLEDGPATYVFCLKSSGHRFKVDLEDISTVTPGGYEVRIHRRGSEIEGNAASVAPRLTDDALLLPLMSGVQWIRKLTDALAGIRTYAIDPARMKEPQVPDDGLALRGDGSNVASVVRELRKTDRWPTLMAFLQAAVPQVQDVEAKRQGARLSLNFRLAQGAGESVQFEGFQASDGTLRILGILLALLQKPTPTLVALEEPEANIHPGALGVLLDAIRYASASTQVVVTTQSPDLLDADWIKAENIRLVEWQNGVSDARELSGGTADVLQRHLRTPGELLRSGALESSD
jgi:predicted ATPase